MILIFLSLLVRFSLHFGKKKPRTQQKKRTGKPQSSRPSSGLGVIPKLKFRTASS